MLPHESIDHHRRLYRFPDLIHLDRRFDYEASRAFLSLLLLTRACEWLRVESLLLSLLRYTLVTEDTIRMRAEPGCELLRLGLHTDTAVDAGRTDRMVALTDDRILHTRLNAIAKRKNKTKQGTRMSEPCACAYFLVSFSFFCCSLLTSMGMLLSVHVGIAM